MSNVDFVRLICRDKLVNEDDKRMGVCGKRWPGLSFYQFLRGKVHRSLVLVAGSRPSEFTLQFTLNFTSKNLRN